MLLPRGLLRHRWTTKSLTTLNCQGDPRDIGIVLKPFSYSPLRPEQYYGLPWALEVGLGVLALNAHISSLWHFCGSMATNTVCNVQDERQKLDWGERLARWTLKKVNETIFSPPGQTEPFRQSVLMIYWPINFAHPSRPLSVESHSQAGSTTSKTYCWYIWSPLSCTRQGTTLWDFHWATLPQHLLQITTTWSMLPRTTKSNKWMQQSNEHRSWSCLKMWQLYGQKSPLQMCIKADKSFREHWDTLPAHSENTQSLSVRERTLVVQLLHCHAQLCWKSNRHIPVKPHGLSFANKHTRSQWATWL